MGQFSPSFVTAKAKGYYLINALAEDIFLSLFTTVMVGNLQFVNRKIFFDTFVFIFAYVIGSANYACILQQRGFVNVALIYCECIKFR